MKQTTRSLFNALALVVVAGAITGVAYWANRDEAKKAEQKEKSEKLFDFDRSKAQGLRLEKDGALVADARRSGEGWTLVEPLRDGGDGVPLNAMVEQLSTLKQKKDLGDEKPSPQYGLDKPHLRVTLTLEGGASHTLEIGETNPFDNTLYVRRDADPTVRLVEAFVKATFEKTLFDLRDKQVARVDPAAEVKRLEVTGVKLPYALVKEGAAWKLEKPAQAADASTVERLVSSIRALRATGVAAEKAAAPGQYGLAAPKATVKLTLASGTRTLVVGQAGGKTYARRDDSPAVYEVDAQILKDLAKDLAELQDKSLVHVDREQVRKLALESQAGRLVLTRTKIEAKDGGVADETFALVEPRSAPAKKWKVSGALYSILGLRAVSFEKPKRSAKPAKTVTLFGDGDKVLARIRLFGESGGKRLVQVEGSDRMALVENAVVDGLPWKVEDAAEAPAVDAGTVPAQASAK